MRNKISEFSKGVLYAAGIIAGYDQDPATAAFVLREAGLENADCKGMDDFDKQNLKLVQSEKGIHLKNL